MAQSICVLGAGSWGSALTLLLASNHHNVTLWGYDAEKIALLRQSRRNTNYLPDITFPANVTFAADLRDAVKNAELTVIAVPSFAFRQTVQPLAQLKPNLVVATKGLDGQTHQLLHQVIQQELGEVSFAFLSGPTFAKEVAQKKPSAAVIASFDAHFAKHCQTLFHTDYFRAYSHHDVIGVEICGVVKNVLAIGSGISDGMQLGANACAALLTRGVAEMRRLVTACGGEEQTLLGLAGIGDLVLTATGNLSRNRRFGLAVGRGLRADHALREVGQVVEGLDNVKQVCALAKELTIEMPIATEINKILFENLNPRDALENLLMRDPTAE